MLEPMKRQLERLRDRTQFRNCLLRLRDNPDFGVFFRMFLRHCSVTKPRFSRDPQEILWWESRRHLAMSYLSLLAQDDPQTLIDRLEREQQDKEPDE